MSIGFLGFEKFEPTKGFWILPTYSTVLFQHINKVLKTPIGETILNRLASDSRIAEIEAGLITTGFGASKTNKEAIAQWWLWRANEIGPKVADVELETYLGQTTVPIQICLWVYGLEVKERISLGNGIELIPLIEMPASDDKERHLKQSTSFLTGPTVPAPTAALVKSITTRKLVTESQPAISDHHQEWSAERHLNQAAFLLNCLPTVRCFPAYRTTYFPDHVPPGPFSGKSAAWLVHDILPNSKTSPNSQSFENIPTIIEAFNELGEKLKARIQSALFRLAVSKFSNNHDQSALDLGIALEMLLLNPEHHAKEIPQQLNLTFRLRGAWLIGKDADERHELFKNLGNIYSLRSQVAHNGRSKNLAKLAPDERRNLAATHFSIAERIVQRLIVGGVPEDWNRFILGIVPKGQTPPTP